MYVHVHVFYMYILYCLFSSLFRSIVSSISSDKRVLSLTNKQSLQDALNTMVDQLNRCQKALNEFLEVHYKQDTAD